VLDAEDLRNLTGREPNKSMRACATGLSANVCPDGRFRDGGTGIDKIKNYNRAAHNDRGERR
jgi:hypothetical protein